MLKKSLLLAIGAVFIFSGYFTTNVQGASDAVFRSIPPAEALRMFQQRDDIIFLDVRTPKERSTGYIPGSQLVAFTDIVTGKVSYPKDKPIMLVCAIGGRSYSAGMLLSQKGYTEIYNVSGGISAWYKAGLPLAFDKK